MGKQPIWYETLFRLLDYKAQIGECALDILMKLETSDRIMQDIKTLQSIRKTSETLRKESWDQVLHSDSHHRLLYELQIIEHLMQEGEDRWKMEFIELGGFEHLYRIFYRLVKNQEFERYKNVISCILKIFKTYILAAFARKYPKLPFHIHYLKEIDLELEKVARILKAETQENDKKNYDSIIVENNESSLLIERKKSLELLENASPNKFQDQESLLSLYQCNKNTKKDNNDISSNNLNTQENSNNDKINEILNEDPLLKESDLIITEEFAFQIMQLFELKSFMNLLVEFITETLNKTQDFDHQDRNIISYSLSLILGILSFEPALLSDFFPQAEGPILQGLFCPFSSAIRKYMSHFLFLLIYENLSQKSDLGSLRYIIRKLLENLKMGSNRECEQYHELLCQLIEMTLTLNPKERASIVEFGQILEMVLLALENYHTVEARDGKNTDRVLIGMIKLCEKFVSISEKTEEELALKLFSLLLFNIEDIEAKVGDYFRNLNPSQTSIKCRGTESRKAAYTLILEACKRGGDGSLSNIIIKGLGPLMDQSAEILASNYEYFKISGYNYVPVNYSRSKFGYVGIKNLGCICYMSAMLQQFFMIPAFRYSIMMIDDQKDVDLQVFKEKKIDDNILHQLQELFAFLELSDRIDFNPQSFCFAFKDFQGNPVNVCVQQDAQEFVNMIFDKLENALKGNPFQSILEDVYGGKSCMQLICGECGNKKEREEFFYVVSLEVKNMRTLYESFEKYISGETISDYYCENCCKKAQTTKRSCLSKFPNVMIIHLQRIVFDLDTLQNEKISTRLEFPMELDLYNYSYEKIEGRKIGSNPSDSSLTKNLIKESSEIEINEIKNDESEEIDKPYQYKLAGVVVHVGTASYGHYYSYINIKRDLETRNPSEKFEDKWLEFNDSSIREFDPKNLESECYGGMVDRYQDDWGWNSKVSETSKSAYILIYERERKTPIHMSLEGQKMKPSLMEYLGIETKKGEKSKKLDFKQIQPFISETMHQKVALDNANFMFERNLFNEPFFKFVSELLFSIRIPDLTPNIYTLGYETLYLTFTKDQRDLYSRMIEILLRLIYEVLTRAIDNSAIIELSSLLKHLLYLNPDYTSENFGRFLAKRNQKDYVLNCQDRTVRTNCCSILLHMVNITVGFRGMRLQGEGDMEERRMGAFLDDFLGMIAKGDLGKNMSRFQQYFEVISLILFYFF